MAVVEDEFGVPYAWAASLCGAAGGGWGGRGCRRWGLHLEYTARQPYGGMGRAGHRGGLHRAPV